MSRSQPHSFSSMAVSAFCRQPWGSIITVHCRVSTSTHRILSISHCLRAIRQFDRRLFATSGTRPPSVTVNTPTPSPPFTLPAPEADDRSKRIASQVRA